MDRPSPAFRVPRLRVTPTLAAQSVAKARRGRPRAWPSNIRATRSIAATATAGSRAPRTAPAAQTATRVRPAVGSRGAGVLDVVCWGGGSEGTSTVRSPRRLCGTADWAEVAGRGAGPSVALAFQPALLHLLPAVRRREGTGTRGRERSQDCRVRSHPCPPFPGWNGPPASASQTRRGACCLNTLPPLPRMAW